MWLCRDPSTTIIKHDSRELIPRSFIQNSPIKRKQGIKSKCATTENPQANYILERIHQVIEKLVRTF